MASIVILIIMAGCAVLLFLKGTVVRAFASIIVAICALIGAFSFFEGLAGIIISRGDKGIALSIVDFAQPISFALLFIIFFAVLQTLAIYLTRDKVDLGFWPERVGRVICGLILGLIVSGVLVTALVLAPLPNKYPYERFDSTSPKPDDPKKVFLNIDGFVTNLFSTISNGSLSGKRSFATLHPDYLDQVFLNRLPKDISKLTSTTPAISVPIEKAVWPAPDAIKTQIEDLKSKGELNSSPGRPTGSYVPTIVRVEIKKSALKTDKVNAGKFMASQLRLICKRSTEAKEPLKGHAINVYPIGHFSSQNQMQVTKEIQLESRSYGNATTKAIDFVFCVPNGFTPVQIQFKLNSVVQIRQSAILSDSSQAPPAATYVPPSEDGGGRGRRGIIPRGGRDRGGQGLLPSGPGSGVRGGIPEGGGPAAPVQPNETPGSRAGQFTESITGVETSSELGY